MAEARDKEIRVSVTEAERKEIMAAAESEGLATASYVRVAALRSARGQ